MLQALIAFLPVAALLALSPGPATAMVVHSAARGGRDPAVRVIVGDATGLAVWAVASMLGVSALLVASHAAFATLKVVGAVVLVGLGVQALRRARRPHGPPGDESAAQPRAEFRRGVMTALSNPKVGLFYIALLPQFVPAGSPLLPTTLLLAAAQISLSCAWYLLLVALIGRVRAILLRWARRLEALSGATMIGFGLALAAERR